MALEVEQQQAKLHSRQEQVGSCNKQQPSLLDVHGDRCIQTPALAQVLISVRAMLLSGASTGSRPTHAAGQHTLAAFCWAVRLKRCTKWHQDCVPSMGHLPSCGHGATT